MLLVSAEPDAANYQGPLKDLLAPEASWAVPKSGLAVDLVILEGGAKVAPASLEVAGSKWQGKGKFSFDALKYADGELSGSIGFTNSSSRSLWGVRFDVVGATEELRGAGSGGGTVVLREQSAAQRSPILFGDLGTGGSSGMYPFSAQIPKVGPETVRIVVHCRLSGYTHVGAIPGNDHMQAKLSIAPKGDLLLGSVQRAIVNVWNPSSSKVVEFAKLDAPVASIAANPLTGEVLVRGASLHQVDVFSPDGRPLTAIKESDDAEALGLYGWPNAIAFSPSGNLWINFGNTYSRFENGKPTIVVSRAGTSDLADGQPMKSSNQFVFVATADSVFKFDQSGKAGARVVKGLDMQLGRIHGASSLAVDASGNLIVGEKNDENFLIRVSIFDSDGRFLRAFGHEADQLQEGSAAKGFLYQAIGDMVVAPDGTLYVSDADESHAIQIYVPF